GLWYDQPKVQAQDAVVRAAVRRQMFAGLQDRIHHGDQPGNILADAPCLWTELDVVRRAEAVTRKKEALPAAITADCFDVARQFMEGRQFLLPRQDMVELGADRAPFIFDRTSPGKYFVVVDRRVADFTQSKIE